MDEHKNQNQTNGDENIAPVPESPFYPYSIRDERDEEISGELTADDVANQVADETEDRADQDATGMFGWLALALSVLAFFWMPIVLGAAGIILGIVARNRNAETLGNIAIAAGAIAIIARLFIAPFY